MKLLQLTSSCNRGAIGTIAEALGRGVISGGGEAYLAYGRDARPSALTTYKVGTQADVYAHYARHRLFNGEGQGSGRATRRLCSWMRQLSPDIVHLHCIHDHWLNIPLVAATLHEMDVPVVLTLHDTWLLERGVPMLACLGDNLHLVAPSRWMQEQARQSGLNARLIYNGVDTAIFQALDASDKSDKSDESDKSESRECWDISDKSDKSDTLMRTSNASTPYTLHSPLVLGVAWPWTPLKGLEDMLKVHEITGYPMRLIGLSRGRIRRLPPGVSGTGRIDDPAALAREYARATAMVSPTRGESFGMTLAEAQACGTPVVAYEAGATIEVVDTHTGALVPQGNVEALSQAVKDVVARPSQPGLCRRHVIRSFDQSGMVEGYLELYTKLLKGED